MADRRRPLVRYHGGKWKHAHWIIEHMPPHQTYVEPFGGGGSVLLRKERAHGEVYNDLDDEIVNLFRVARDRGDELKRKLALTPFARMEFDLSYRPSSDPLERARRTVVRSFQGFSGAAVCGQKTGFRSSSARSGSTPAMDWRNFPAALAATLDRMQGVVIENRDAKVVMAHHDRPDTVHYVDPPYLHSTRNMNTKSYKHEMTDEQHAELVVFLQGLRGMVLLSGYPSALYDELLGDWVCVRRACTADGARPRTEVLYLNDGAYAALRNHQADLPLVVCT